MKRKMALLLSVAMGAACLCGCGKTAEQKAGDNGSAVQSTLTGNTVQHLTFWYGLSGTPGEVLQGLIDEYNNSQSDVFVEAQYQGSYEETLNKLKTSVRTDSGPDLVQIYEAGTRSMVDSGFVIPMQEIVDDYGIDVARLEKNILGYYTVDDQLYSMPLNTSIPVCFYNKTVLSQIGYGDGPKTWDDMLTISKLVKEQGLAASGIAMSNSVWSFEQPMVQQHYAMVDHDNGRAGRATKTTFADGNLAVEIATYFQKIFENGYGADVGFTSDANKAAFWAGAAVMMCDSSGALNISLDTIDGAFELGVCDFPALTADADNGGVTLGGGSIYICDNGRGDEARAAIADFVKYIISPEVQATLSTKTGYFPITTEAYELDAVKAYMKEYPQYAAIVDAMHRSSNMGYGPLYASIVEAREVYKKYLEQVMMGELTPEECISKSASEIDRIIADYNDANPIG